MGHSATERDTNHLQLSMLDENNVMLGYDARSKSKVGLEKPSNVDNDGRSKQILLSMARRRGGHDPLKLFLGEKLYTAVLNKVCSTSCELRKLNNEFC